MRMLVRNPALLCRISRSAPINPPIAAASKSLWMSSASESGIIVVLVAPSLLEQFFGVLNALDCCRHPARALAPRVYPARGGRIDSRPVGHRARRGRPSAALRPTSLTDRREALSLMGDGRVPGPGGAGSLRGVLGGGGRTGTSRPGGGAGAGGFPAPDAPGPLTARGGGARAPPRAP